MKKLKNLAFGLLMVTLALCSYTADAKTSNKGFEVGNAVFKSYSLNIPDFYDHGVINFTMNYCNFYNNGNAGGDFWEKSHRIYLKINDEWISGRFILQWPLGVTTGDFTLHVTDNTGQPLVNEDVQDWYDPEICYSSDCDIEGHPGHNYGY